MLPTTPCERPCPAEPVWAVWVEVTACQTADGRTEEAGSPSLSCARGATLVIATESDCEDVLAAVGKDKILPMVVGAALKLVEGVTFTLVEDVAFELAEGAAGTGVDGGLE
jgi:hypothetical protein